MKKINAALGFLTIQCRHISERHHEICREIQAKQILILNHKNELLDHIEGSINSAKIKEVMLLRHIYEDKQLSISNQLGWADLIKCQTKEINKHFRKRK